MSDVGQVNAPSITENKKEETPVKQQLLQLSNNVGVLQEYVSLLEDRLGIVLTNELKDKDDDNTESAMLPASGNSGLVYELNTQNERLERLQQQVYTITRRVEL